MKERPILFSGSMVRAILEGRKTQTRRAIKNPPGQGDWIPAEMCATTSEGYQTSGHSGVWWCDGNGDDQDTVRCPYGIPGDRLWVRETWGFVNHDGYANCPSSLSWRADGRQRIVPVDDVMRLPKTQLPHCGYSLDDQPKWRSSIHMPRWASRITLEVTDIRVERLQEISEMDAFAEGIDDESEAYLAAEHYQAGGSSITGGCPSVFAFADLWDSINGTGSWEANPWVWAITFELATPQ